MGCMSFASPLSPFQCSSAKLIFSAELLLRRIVLWIVSQWNVFGLWAWVSVSELKDQHICVCVCFDWPGTFSCFPKRRCIFHSVKLLRTCRGTWQSELKLAELNWGTFSCGNYLWSWVLVPFNTDPHQCSPRVSCVRTTKFYSFVVRTHVMKYIFSNVFTRERVWPEADRKQPSGFTMRWNRQWRSPPLHHKVEYMMNVAAITFLPLRQSQRWRWPVLSPRSFVTEKLAPFGQ